MASPVIGIDLGTTNTVVAAVRDGRATAIADEHGRTLIPSVVSFHPNGSVLVGHVARERRLVDAANTIYSVKRLIGRGWDSEEVRRARTRFAFQMREGPGQATLVVGRGETYTLPEISAFVLRRAKQVAEAALGGSVERAVITVPANFNDLQRAATKVAGRVAGLEVLRILNEPTAAALAYGFGRTSSQRLLVYDFGGGTFDVTLLDLSDNVFEVLATAGNTFLGGDDIDLAIAERMASDFLTRHRYDPRSNPQAFERLRVSAEALKQRLSVEQEASVTVEDVAHGSGGKPLNLDYRLSRSELEHLVLPIVYRTFDVCQEALGIARLTARDFDQVLLVGGSTRMPLVRRRVEEFFGREVKGNISPDEVVALGAAIQASALTGGERRRGTVPPPPSAARAPAAVAQNAQKPGGKRPQRQTMPGVAPSSSAAQPGAPRARAATVPGIAPTRPAAPSTRGADAELAAREARELLPLVQPRQEEATQRKEPAVREQSVMALGDRDLEDVTDVTRSPFELDAAVSGFDAGEDEPTRAAQRPRAVGPMQTVLGLGAPLDPPLPAPMPPTPAAAAAAAVVPRAPLLVDVTPLTLSVETVSGYCDAIIARNTPVPCEQSRAFVTASDGQTVVKVRVAQGESKRFGENTLLGEVELPGLPPAPRGDVQIAVTFALDANGMLNVSARETASGRATRAELRLQGLPGADDVSAMALRNEQRQTS